MANKSIPDFVVVIYPTTVNPDAIIHALKINKAIAVNVLTYSEWLNTMLDSEHNLLCILKNGEMLYARTATEKAQIRLEVKSFI